MRVPLLTEFHHTLSADIRRGTRTTEIFIMYRGINHSHCAQIPVARKTKLYTVSHDVSILRADFPAHTKVCITPHVLSRKCPKSELHRAFPNCGSWVRNPLHSTFLAPRIWRLCLYFWKIRRRLVVVTWSADLISSNQKPRLFSRYGDSPFATVACPGTTSPLPPKRQLQTRGFRVKWRTVLSLNGLCHCHRMKALRFWFVNIGGGSALI